MTSFIKLVNTEGIVCFRGKEKHRNILIPVINFHQVMKSFIMPRDSPAI